MVLVLLVLLVLPAAPTDSPRVGQTCVRPQEEENRQPSRADDAISIESGVLKKHRGGWVGVEEGQAQRLERQSEQVVVR